MRISLAKFYVGLLSILLAASAAAADSAPRSFQAQWIWNGKGAQETFQFARFRKVVKLDQKPSKASAYISADTFYRMWINGRFVMQGPARSSANHATIDTLNVGPFLRRGDNEVMVEVQYYGNIGYVFETLSQAPGLLCELDLGKTKIGTDSTWETSEIAAYNRNTCRFSIQRGIVEDYDDRKDATASWSPARVVGPVGCYPWRITEMRDIPLPRVDEVGPASVVAVHRAGEFTDKVDLFYYEGDAKWPVTPTWQTSPPDWIRRMHTEKLSADSSAAENAQVLTTSGKGDAVLKGDGAGVTYDFGALYVGFIGLDVTGKAGQVIEIAWTEALTDGDKSVRPRQWVDSNQALRYTLRDGRQTFLCFNPQSVRYLRIQMRGQGDVTIHRLWLNQYCQSLPQTGFFTCSDEGLNKVYNAAKRTLMLTVLDTFMDCPSRERAGWSEDHSIAIGPYAVWGDISVYRRWTRSIAESQGLHPIEPGLVNSCYPRVFPRTERISFIAHNLNWVLMVGTYERLTGDAEFARTMLTPIRWQFEEYAKWQDEFGLLDKVPSPLWFDWCEYDAGANGVSLPLNMMYARALDESARLERLYGNQDVAEDYEAAARKIRTSLRQLCPDGLLYPDALERDKDNKLVPRKMRSELTQYFALWGNLPDKEREGKLWQAFRDSFVPGSRDAIKKATGVSTFCEVSSLDQRFDTAIRRGDYDALIRDLKCIFLPMAESVPGTLWEKTVDTWSHCHSITGYVDGFLIRDVLGIGLEPKLRIAPHSGGMLRWCKGEAKTINGLVKVSWKLDEGRYEIKTSLLKGVTAELVLPAEAKSVWSSAKSTETWPASLPISGNATVVVEPGKISRR